MRLAPLYDIASALPYAHLNPHELKLAMKIGAEYRLRNIWRPQWQSLAVELRLDPDQVVERVAALAERLPDGASRVLGRSREQGLTHPILDRLSNAAIERARTCLRALRA